MFVLVVLVVLGLVLWKISGSLNKKKSDTQPICVPTPPCYPLVGNMWKLIFVSRNVQLIGERVTNPIIHPDFIHRLSSNYREQQACIRVLHEVSSNIIQEKMKERQEQKIKESDSDDSFEKNKCLIEVLLSLSDPVTGSLSMEDVNNEVNTFLFSGHDTVATSLSWTLLLLGQHPEVQKHIFQELDDVFGNSDRLPDSNDLAQLKYLDCVYKESLRLYPPIPFIVRRITEDVVVGDYLIKAEVDLCLHIHRLHRSPEYYRNPNKFDPSHFYDHIAKNRHPYAYIPFSAGIRNCIGRKYAIMEAKIMLIQILRNFEIESQESMEEMVPILDLLLVPEKGAKIKIRRRIEN